MERNDRVNWSTLKSILTSPKHYLHALSTPRSDTDAMLLGRLTHALVFEPDTVSKRYDTSPQFNRAMNDDTARAKGYEGGKQAAALWEADMAASKKEIVTDRIMGCALGMAEAVRADPIAGPIVSTGWSERTIEWTDALTGIECRGRLDHVNGRTADLKSTRSLMFFERDAARLGYFWQLAWYVDGLAATGVVTENEPCLIAVESDEPFDVLVLTFTEDDLAIGRRVYRSALDRLAECRRSGVWPGVSGGVSRRVMIPAWVSAGTEVELTLDGEKI